jgi:uncharacterized protein (DUF952 family)
MFIYHVAERSRWEAARVTGRYVAESLEQEGFIHCADRYQIEGVLERFFLGRTELCLLCVDPGRLRAEVRREKASDAQGAFPHVYGPIDAEAVVAVVDLPPIEEPPQALSGQSIPLGEVTIAERFRGPPESGNGGYSCGALAEYLTGPVEVTLKKPPRLDRSMLVYGDGEVRLQEGIDRVAEARAAPLELPVPPKVPFEWAIECSKYFAGFDQHPIPGCFVCGPERAVGDGLRIFPGHVNPNDPLAAPFVPGADLADDAGWVRPVFLWAALDCPGYFAGSPGEVALLGRMTAEVIPGIRAGDKCVLLAWSLGREGRKIHAGTAIYGQDGTLYGRSRQVWIAI